MLDHVTFKIDSWHESNIANKTQWDRNFYVGHVKTCSTFQLSEEQFKKHIPGVMEFNLNLVVEGA